MTSCRCHPNRAPPCRASWGSSGPGRSDVKRYIASDLHNGNGVTDYDRVMSFLEMVDDQADEFLILGDWFELLWSNVNILTTVAPFSHVTDKVKGIAGRKPVKLVLGNHDWSLGFFTSIIEPLTIVKPFVENGVYYTHGHEWDWVSLILGTPVDPIYWSVYYPFALPPAIGMWIIDKWFGGEEDRYFWGISLIHERISAFARKNGYHSVVFGHTHFPTVELRGGINLYADGDQVDSYSYLVEEDGLISLHRY